MELKKIRLKSYLGRPWRYLYKLLILMRHNKPLPFDYIYEAGGRKCGKTESFNRFFGMAFTLCPDVTFAVYTIRLQQGAPRQYSWDEAIKVAPDGAENSLGWQEKSKFLLKGKNFRWYFLGMLDRGTKKGIQKLGLPRYDADYTIILFDEASELSADHLHMVKSAVRLNAKTLIVGLANPYFPYSAFFVDLYARFPPPVKVLEDEATGGRAWQIKDRTLCQGTNIFAIKNAHEPYFSKVDLRELVKGLTDAPLTGRTSLYGLPMALKGACFPEPLLRKIKYFTNPASVFSLHDPSVEVLAGLDFGFTSDPGAFIWGFRHNDRGKIALMGGFKGSASQAGEFDTLKFVDQVHRYCLAHILPYLTRLKKTLLVGTDSHALSLTSSLNQQRPTVLKDWIEFRSVSQKFRMPLTIVRRIESVLDMLANKRLFFKTNETGNDELRKEGGSSYGKEPASVESVKSLHRVAPLGDHLQDAFEYGFVEQQN